MKEFRKFFIIQLVSLAAILVVLSAAAGSGGSHRLHRVNVNDLIETVKENRNQLSALDSKEFSMDMLVLGPENQILYSSSAQAFEGIHSPLDAMNQNFLTIPVSDGKEFLGTCIIQDPSKVKGQEAMQKILVIACIAAAMLLLSYAGFFYYIHRTILKPFRGLKTYAALISQGKLDEPLMMEKNNIFGIFTESFDTMREELKSSRERELALKRKEKELVASLSHDLKTPVTGIKLICELLLVKTEDEYVKSKLANISHKAEEIHVLLNNLLSSALEDLNEMSVSCREEMSDILDQLLDEHDPQGKVEATEVPGCIIHTDRHRLSQVIGNIISNSYKYAGTRIAVTYRFHEAYLEMSIRDYGEGVDLEEITLLTQKFYRGKKNTSEKDGSGLGLYIANELMERMNGTLICHSGQEGFCVTLRIPLA